MTRQKYKRTIEELELRAEKWWPKSLEADVASISVVPMLVSTQEQFISILNLSGKFPTQVFDILKASQLPANLFLKHLVVLADYGGEMIKRLGKEFHKVFPANKKTSKHLLSFVFKGNSHVYEFQCLPVMNLDNSKLSIDGKAICNPIELNALYQDMVMILMYGSVSEAAHLAGLEKCEIGTLLGDKESLKRYVSERYIHVSRITNGARSNSLGQIAQDYVIEILKQLLSEDFHVLRNGKIILSNYDKEGGMPFDVVVERSGKKIGIEVTFQVTTNSVIERKAGQADSRMAAMHNEGHWICYVIDGAGNFQREAAVSTLCRFSDCTVAYSQDEIALLAQFIKEKLQ